MTTFTQTERIISSHYNAANTIKAGLDNIAASNREYTQFLQSQVQTVRVSGIRDCVDYVVGGIQRVVDLLAIGVRPMGKSSNSVPALSDFADAAKGSGYTPVEMFGQSRGIIVDVPLEFLRKVGRGLTPARLEAIALAACEVELCEVCWSTGTIDCIQERGDEECWASDDPSDDCMCEGAQYLPCPICISVQYDLKSDLERLLGQAVNDTTLMRKE